MRPSHCFFTFNRKERRIEIKYKILSINFMIPGISCNMDKQSEKGARKNEVY